MANKLGVHNLMFTDDPSEDTMRAAVDAAARIGFDVFETLIFDPATFHAPRLRRLAKDASIDLALGLALGQETDISSPDREIAKRGAATVIRCLDIAGELGVGAVSGIVYAAFNRYAAPPSASQKAQVAEALSLLDEEAGRRELRLGLEPVNRYESYLVNTLDEAGALIRSIGGGNLFIHMDTFHMNIEESDIAGAIARNADLLGYAHVAENTRGALRADAFDFPGYFRALARAGYRGGVTVEAFSNARLGPDLAGAIGLWRRQWTDAQEAARSALAFLKAEIAAAAAAVEPW
jgi:D-psicose/D-tagatose/L-ribulose 3-epimerase